MKVFLARVMARVRVALVFILYYEIRIVYIVALLFVNNIDEI